MEYPIEVIKGLTLAFAQIDFTQPCAHEVFRELSKIEEHIVTDTERVSNYQFAFYALGAEFTEVEKNYQTIPPVGCVQKDGKPE